MVLPLTGSVAVENGLDTFTWTGAPLTPLNCVVGASIVVNGLGYFVQELTDTTHGTFTRVYAEATNASRPAEIEQLSPDQVATATLNKRAAEVFAQLAVVEANGRGFLVRFSDNTADVAPDPGYMAINHASMASSTGGYFHNLDGNGATVAGEIDTWDNSSSISKGKLWLRSLSDPAAFHAVKVTGAVIDGGSYRKLTWTYDGGSGSFSAGEDLMAFFVPTGDRGEGFITDADAVDPSELTAYEAEDAGFLVFVTDLETEFGAYSGRSGVVRLIAGPDWELAALYTGPQGAASTVPGPTGPAGIVWVDDEWDSDTTYAEDEGTQREGSSWRSLQDGNLNHAPPTLPTISNAWWALVARRGIDGAGTVNSIVAGDGIAVDNTDPTAPIISIPSFGDLFVTVSLLALQVADNANVALFLGGAGNRVADSFDALTYVDVAGAANLNSATAGVLKPSLVAPVTSYANPGGTGNRTGTITATSYPTLFAVGTAPNLINGNIETPSESYFSNGTNTTGLWVAFDFGTPKVIDEIKIYQSAINAQGTWKVQWSDDNAAWTDIGASFVWGDAATKTVSFANSMAHRYWRIYGVSGSTTNGPYQNEIEFKIDVPSTAANNLTVRSASFTAASAPTKMKALIRVKEVDTAVAGTDYTLECSRDDGTTWTAMVLTELFTSPSPAAGICVVEAAETDISSQPSGTAPRWRFKTLNSKLVELHDVYLYWS